MSLPVYLPRRLPLSSRLTATVLACVVFGLGLLAVAPAAHEHLHADAAQSDPACAVTLFAQGVTTAAVAVVVAVYVRQAQPLVRVAVVEAFAAPARLRPPTCGPPRS